MIEWTLKHISQAKIILRNLVNTHGFVLSVILSLCPIIFMSCNNSGMKGKSESQSEQENNSSGTTKKTATSEKKTDREIAEDLREKLNANDFAIFIVENGKVVEADLYNSEVEDLSALEGLPLRKLMLEKLKVKSISPLKGMDLETLLLNEIIVDDFSPLADVKVKMLNLNQTEISDLSPLKNMPLNTLWIPHTKVKDLSPLAGQKMISLDCEDTEVSDLKPVSTIVTLERLNICQTEVHDLTPIANLKLTRLIFTPQKITSGIDAVRKMSTITEIGSTLENRMTPLEFWPLYDEWKQRKEKSESAK